MKITVTKRIGPVSVFKFGLRNELRNSRAFWAAVRQGKRPDTSKLPARGRDSDSRRLSVDLPPHKQQTTNLPNAAGNRTHRGVGPGLGKVRHDRSIKAARTN